MVILEEAAAEVLASVIMTAGRKIKVALTATHGRSANARQIAQWFDTYRLTGNAFPKLAALYPDAQLRFLYSADAQAVLHELLAARITNTPEADVHQLSAVFQEAADGQITSDDSLKLFNFFDQEIKDLVKNLRESEQEFLQQIQQQAYFSRIVSAIQRHSSNVFADYTSLGTRLDFMERYRRHLREQHGELRPPDFERRRKVPIEALYVPQVMTQSMESADNPSSQIDIWGLDQLIDRTVLLGNPGVGKTTAAQALLYLHAMDAGRPLPFLVVLREFAADDVPAISVLRYIENKLETFYQCKPSPGVIERLLLNGSSLVIFDGLDELVDTRRRANVSDVVERFCSEYPLTRVLVTSRTIGYDEARLDDRQFTCYYLQDFGDEAVHTYVKNWFASDENSEHINPETFLAESASVVDLRRNPLMLGLMCILYRGEGSIPRNRAEMYEKCTKLLFEKWDAIRKIHVDLRARSLVEQSIRYIAYWLLTRNDGQAVVTERELISETKNYFLKCGYERPGEAEDAAAEFVGFCRGRMWVLTEVGTTSRGESLYTFTHRTFLEYYAAYYLTSINDAPEQLARTLSVKIARAEWDTIAQLAVQIKARSAEQGGERIFQELLAEAARQDLQSCGNTLSFLGRCTAFIEPAASSVRMLTNFGFKFLISNPNDKALIGPLGWLMLTAAPEIRDVISDELYQRTSELIGSADPKDQLIGLRVAANRDLLPRAVGEVGRSWGWDERFEMRIVQGAQIADDLAAWTCCYSQHAYDLLKARPNIGEFLFHRYPAHILGLSWEAPAVSLLLKFIRYDSQVLPAFIALSERLGDGLFPGFTSSLTTSFGGITREGRNDVIRPDTSIERSARDASLFRSPSLYATAAYLLAISVEGPGLIELPSSIEFGPLSDFYAYVICRRNAVHPGNNAWRGLGLLPVNDYWNGLFLRWARGELNFGSNKFWA